MRKAIKIYSEEHSKLVQKRLFELGYMWVQNPRNVICLKFCVYIYLSYYSEGLLTHSIDKEKDITIITTEDLFKDDSLKVFIPTKVKLNEDYEAVIQQGYIEVGCQKISFNSIVELYDKIIKINSSRIT